ncbi:MAG: UDP-3-O-(3-hydroxymyristoyl)glucosamine N-acyltransferase [Pseudomonadota bacterium]
MYTLGELAQRLGLSFSGDAERSLSGLSTLAAAGPDDLSFLANRRYATQLSETLAGAVILQAEFVDQCPSDCLIAEDPYLAFARLSGLFDRSPKQAAGVHPSATVADGASVDESASIGPQAVVEEGAVLGPDVTVGALAYIGHNCEIGKGCIIHAGASVQHSVRMGRYCVIHPRAVIGGDGFGFAPGPDGWEKIHQLGGVLLGECVEVGACTTIDRGALADTVLEDGVIVDNLVQIAHNCHIGKNTAIAGCSGLAGSTIIGANCTLAGGVGVVGHVEICDNVHVTGMTMVTKSITEPGSYSSGTPMTSTRDWKRNAVGFAQLDAIRRRLKALEQSQHP